MQTVHLIGADQVQNAGIGMRAAAAEMTAAAITIDAALDRHHAFMEDWLQRFTAVLEENLKPREVFTGDPSLQPETIVPGTPIFQPAERPQGYATCPTYGCSKAAGHEGEHDTDDIPF